MAMQIPSFSGEWKGRKHRRLTDRHPLSWNKAWLKSMASAKAVLSVMRRPFVERSLWLRKITSFQ